MHVVIGGGGVLGTALGAALVQHGHDVVIVEQDQQRCDKILAPLGVVPICGSATSISELETAGIRRADVAIAVMGRDADNLAFCLLARHLKVRRIMTRMVVDKYRTPLEIAGATLIFSESDMVLGSLMTSIELPEVTGLMKIRRGDLNVFELLVPPNARVAGMKVRDVAADPRFPRQCLFVGIASGRNDVRIPSGNSEITGGASVILVCRPDDLPAVVGHLTERRDLEDLEGQSRSVRKVLRAQAVFAALNDDEISELTRRAYVVYPERGKRIFRAGEAGNEMFVLSRGRVKLVRAGADEQADQCLADLQAPDFFGEYSPVTGKPRLSDAVAAVDSELIVVDADAFRAVLAARPEALLEVTRHMNKRLAEFDMLPGGNPTHPD